MTYSEALQKHEGPFSIASSRNKRNAKRRKRKRLNAKQQSSMPPNNRATKSLRGQRREEGIHLYLESIYKDTTDTDSEVEKMVKQHGHRIGVRVLFARVVPNRYCDHIVGCKIIVPLSQIYEALDSGNWPDQIKCRKWEVRQTRRDRS